MDTPITVSSTSTVPNKSDFLQLNYSPCKNEDSVISLGSTTSFERVPVSWNTRDNVFARTESNTTLTNIQKVSNWIKSIEGENDKSDDIVVELENNVMDLSYTESVKSEEGPKNNTESKSVILYRCDFNKSVTAKTYYPPLNTFNTSTSLITYFKNEKEQTLTGNNSNNFNCVDQTDNLNSRNQKVPQKHLLLKRPSSSKLINYPSQIKDNFSIDNENYHSKINDEKSDVSSDIYDVQMSPESRKKELCSYLQLMNPADKKERFILQNRRSTRVRNLAAMQEKREMERKIRASEVDNPDIMEKEVEKCATLKSFKELNIRVEKAKFSQDLFEEKVVDFEVPKDDFCFPFPSKDLTEKVSDFDSTMSKLVPRYKQICKLRKLKLHCNIKLINSTPKNKENLIKNIVKSNPKKTNLVQNVKTKKTNINSTAKGHNLKEILKQKKCKKPLFSERSNSLRSNGTLKNVTLKKLIGKKEKELLNQRKNIRRKELRERQQMDKIKLRRPTRNSSTASSGKNSKLKSDFSQCEIITIGENNEDHVDLENFMDDMIDFNNLSEEHKRCLIESRILSTKPMPPPVSSNAAKEETSFHSIQAVSPLYGFNKSDINEVKKMCLAYKNSILLKNSKSEVMTDYISNQDEIKVEESVLNDVENKTEIHNFESAPEKLPCSMTEGNLEQNSGDNKLDIKIDDQKSINKVPTNGITLQEHDYAGLLKKDDEDTEVDVVTVPSKNLPVRNCIEINPRSLGRRCKFEVLPYNKSVEMKSLHRSLQHLKKKNSNPLSVDSFVRDTVWDTDISSKAKMKKQSHYISINKDNGAVLKAFYIDYNLIVCQEYMVSFWMQTPLGHVLGSQNMWIPRGETQRLVLNSKCIQKESMEMVIAMETHVAYVELWTKEHKSDIREGPVADVFATLYFWKQRQTGLEKKVLQLENIKGFADDVQYSVMKCTPKIIVSWHSANEDSSTAKRTFIHAYQLASDYQTVSNIYNIEPVDHYVSSLHNIEDCDSLIMGCGENKITLWNVEYGYIVATIELSEIKSPLSTLWVKCDRGFLFALQQCVDRELRLIAINGINHSWKKLASYNPPEGFDRLRGVCIENGLLLSFYDQGILCWKAETGEPVEESNVEADIIPSGEYVILLEDNQIIVKHAVTHLMSMSMEET